METISPDQIIVTVRQRKKFVPAPMDELAESILANGILHVPVMRAEITASGVDLILVAGERRLRAMQKILLTGRQIRCGDFTCPPGEIPFHNLGVMTEIEAFEAELAENLRREDLTWQEQAVAEAELADMMRTQNEKLGLAPPTAVAIATEVVHRRSPDAPAPVGDQISRISNRIRLAEHLDNPEVAKAKTEADAIKVVRKIQEQGRIATLAAAFEASPRRDNPHTLLTGDMREQMAGIASASIDVLLTDPPYGIDADTFGEQSGQGHSYEDSEAYFTALISVLSEESYRVCKPQAHAYVFCDPRRFAELQLHFELAGWKVWPIPLIWYKRNGMLPRPEYAPRRVYESIMFASKGDRPVRLVKPDVIDCSSDRDLKHGAQKPVALYVDLLSRSAFPGNTVLDPFAGSGTIFPASNIAQVHGIGIELSPEYANLCRIRMNETEEVPVEVDIEIDL